MTEFGPIGTELKRFYPDLQPPVPVCPQQTEEADTVESYKNKLKAVRNRQLSAFVVRASGVRSSEGHMRTTGLRELAALAIDLSDIEGEPHRLDGSKRFATETWAACLHTDKPPRGMPSRINMHRIGIGSVDVLWGHGPAIQNEIRQQEGREQWATEYNHDGQSCLLLNALNEALEQGQTLPDLLDPEISTVSLDEGDTLIMSERPDAHPDGVIWHRFTTTTSPRASTAVWLAPVDRDNQFPPIQYGSPDFWRSAYT